MIEWERYFTFAWQRINRSFETLIAEVKPHIDDAVTIDLRRSSSGESIPFSARALFDFEATVYRFDYGLEMRVEFWRNAAHTEMRVFADVSRGDGVIIAEMPVRNIRLQENSELPRQLQDALHAAEDFILEQGACIVHEITYHTSV